MNKEFIKEMNREISKVTTYKTPCVIILSGDPFCGKTELARTLSKELEIFLLSSDYIRNYYYQFTDDYSEEKRLEIEDVVNNINQFRLDKLLNTRTSFVYDRDFNKREEFEKIKEYTDSYGFQLIKIKVDSTDSHNLEEIRKVVMDYNKIYPGVIGDKIEYQSSFDDETYYRIKMRKPHDLSDEFFDFVINNDNEEHFREQTKALVKTLREDYLVITK